MTSVRSTTSICDRWLDGVVILLCQRTAFKSSVFVRGDGASVEESGSGDDVAGKVLGGGWEFEIDVCGGLLVTTC